MDEEPSLWSLPPNCRHLPNLGLVRRLTSDPVPVLAHLRQSAVPMQEDIIPNLPRGELDWREAIRQWENSDLPAGRPALKDWPHEWYTGKM